MKLFYSKIQKNRGGLKEQLNEKEGLIIFFKVIASLFDLLEEALPSKEIKKIDKKNPDAFFNLFIIKNFNENILQKTRNGIVTYQEVIKDELSQKKWHQIDAYKTEIDKKSAEITALTQKLEDLIKLNTELGIKNNELEKKEDTWKSLIEKKETLEKNIAYYEGLEEEVRSGKIQEKSNYWEAKKKRCNELENSKTYLLEQIKAEEKKEKKLEVEVQGNESLLQGLIQGTAALSEQFSFIDKIKQQIEQHNQGLKEKYKKRIIPLNIHLRENKKIANHFTSQTVKDKVDSISRELGELDFLLGREITKSRNDHKTT